jgi:profilin
METPQDTSTAGTHLRHHPCDPPPNWRLQPRRYRQDWQGGYLQCRRRQCLGRISRLQGTYLPTSIYLFGAPADSKQPQPQEIQAIVQGFKDAAGLYKSGINIEGEKYFCIKSDERSIYGKKVRRHFSSQLLEWMGCWPRLQDKHGIVCVKTKQALLVAHYPDSVQPGEAAKLVEALGDYLIGVGY